ncbi:hypothetical protein FAIPA1_100125 [Frankia sp. AiPs1]
MVEVVGQAPYSGSGGGGGPVPLSVLDLSPIVSGSSAALAVRHTVDLARQAERFGYARYWIAEHHLTPGVAAAVPEILIGAVAAATTTIRVGSGAVQTGHSSALVIAERSEHWPSCTREGSISALVARVRAAACAHTAAGPRTRPPVRPGGRPRPPAPAGWWAA